MDSARSHDETGSFFACKLCTKNFRTDDLLNAHIKRRHAKDDTASPSRNEREKGVEESPENRSKIRNKNKYTVQTTDDEERMGRDTRPCPECSKRAKGILQANEVSIQCNMESLVDHPRSPKVDKIIVHDAKSEKEDILDVTNNDGMHVAFNSSVWFINLTIFD